MTDIYGRPAFGGWGGLDRRIADLEAINAMMFPVRCCHCDQVYDLAKVEVTARYADCSMWKSPCCGRTVDDRGETGWKTLKDYVRIEKPLPLAVPDEDMTTVDDGQPNGLDSWEW